MTDPFTLLADHPPAVPDASPAERAAARAVLEAAIRVEPAPATGRGRGRVGRRRALVGASAAAGVAAVTATVLLWPTAAPRAEATWAPEPGRLSPAEVDVVDAGCRTAFDAEAPADLGIVHVDRRGGTALAFYEGDAGAVRSQCFSTLAGTTWQVEGTNTIWLLAPPAGGWLGVEHLLDVAVGGAGPSGFVWAAGVVDAEVARVEVVVAGSGEPLEASLADGHFTAYWPSEQEGGDVTVRLYGGDGDLLLDYVHSEEAIARAAADEAVRAVEVDAVAPAPGG